MKKSTLKKYLTELKKALPNTEAQKAIETLSDLVKDYREEIKEVSSSDFSLPAEVLGNQSAFAFYTDGACRGNPGPGSYAYIVQDHTGEVIAEGAKHSEHTTNNKMELSAVINGLDYLSPQLSPMHSVIVFTDSKYIVDGMKSWVAGWKKRGWKKADNKAPENVDLWQKLDELRNLCHVDFRWVKGHSGHPQNEYVDQLANKVLDENGF